MRETSLGIPSEDPSEYLLEDPSGNHPECPSSIPQGVFRKFLGMLRIIPIESIRGFRPNLKKKSIQNPDKKSSRVLMGIMTKS